MIIYNNLRTNVGKLEYNLDINNDITLIEGDSAVGKSLMISRIQDAVIK